jgi:uncharacterized protein
MNPFHAIRLGQSEKLGHKLSDMQLILTNEEGQGLLHEAVAYGRLDIGKSLIKEGIEIDHQDKEGRTPLHYAAIHRNPDFARMLVENGTSPNLIDKHGNGPLWAAVFNAKGSYGVVKTLMKVGADPNHRNNHKKSPLDFASQIKDAALLEILQNHDENPI